MIIKYKKMYLYRMLVFGIAFVLLGSATFIPAFSQGALGGFIGIGLGYIGIFFYQAKKQYLFIGSDFIKKNGLPGQKFYFKDITGAKFFAGDYIIKAGKREMVISKDIMDEASKSDFDSFWSTLIK